MESQSISAATNIDIWQRNASQRKKNEKQGNVSNMTRKGIQPRTVKKHSQ